MAEKKMHRVMALKSIRHVEGDLTRAGEPVRMGTYAVPGKQNAVFWVTAERYERLESFGAVAELEVGRPPKPGEVDEGAPVPAADDVIPDDFPERRRLFKNGLKTRSLIREFGDLTKIDGIGDATAAKILAALDELEQQGDDED